jgi:UDP-glucose 4-epimerase
MTSRQRFVVSGGAGFIGHHTVAALLADGARVLVVDDLRHACPAGAPPEAELVAADIAAPETAAALARFRPDAVLHLAAQAGVNRSRRDPAGDAQVNVVGTVALVKAALDAGVERFVMASTGGAIYGQAARLPTPETARAQPRSPYGAAKLACEGYLGMFGRSHGLKPLALRYGNVYGPLQDGTGEAGVVAITCTRLLDGRPPVLRGDGRQTRDFVFVEDVAEANVRGLRSDHVGVLNVGTGVGSSIAEVMGELIRAAGGGVEPESAPLPEGEVRDSALDVRRAGRLLGWNPRTDLRSGLDRTYRSFQSGARSN